MAPRVLHLEEVRSEDAALFGHKAASLGVLLRGGFAVPAGFAISGEAFREHVTAALGASFWAGGDELEELDGVRVAVEGAPIDQGLLAEMEAALSGCGLDGRPLAVRSSSTDEDGGLASGAGIQKSLLGVVDRSAFVDAVRAVWGSMWSEAARSYRCRADRGEGRALMGVIVQLLVEPDTAGVLFTANPVTGARDEIMVNCAFGLGEPVLSGLVTPDTFVVDKETLSTTGRAVSDKRRMVVAGPRGVTTMDTPEELRREPSLSAEQLRAVAELGRRVERHFGEPRDVEWAVVGPQVHLLQARPITALPRAEDGPASSAGGVGSQDVWTNANVGDALPGVATPLTWSIASRYSDRGFRRAFSALACEVPDGAVLVGSFRGRIYLNLTQFLAIAAQVPLLSGSSLSELAGSVAPQALEAATGGGGFQLSGRFLLRLPGAAVRLVRQHLALERSVSRLEQRVQDAARRLQRTSLSDRPASSVREELLRTDALLDETGDAMLTCAATSMATHLLLKLLIERWLPGQRAGLERELIAGAADLESAKPGIALWHLAEAIRGDERAARVLVESDPAELSPSSFAEGSEVRRDLESFVASHGYRAVMEAELMTPRWSEEPTLIFATLREYVRSGGLPPGREIEEHIAERHKAWESVDAKLDPVRGAVVRNVAEAARRYARLRERLRARVTQVLGMIRSLALEAGARLGDEEAVFFLNIEELYEYLEGGLDAPGPLIAARRRQHEAFEALPDPPPTFVGSPPEAAPIVPLGDQERLEGLPASPGEATGTARVLVDQAQAGQLRAGDILVVACADVGWSPLFLLAGAVVTDRGGVLSHASVVAREYGVPAVVDVRDATKVIRTGQRLTVSGDSGVILIHDEG